MEGGIERVETSRAPASAFLLIDSQDRSQVASSGDFYENLQGFEPQPLNDFTIYKRQPFLSGYFHRIAVTECRFEFNSPNINPRNNMIYLNVEEDTEQLYEILVPTGYYTPSELATKMTELLNAAYAGQNFLCVYVDNHFRVTANTAFALEPFYDPEFYPELVPERSLFFMMGFNTAQGFSTTFNGAVFPNMCYTRYVDVCSRTLTQYQRVKDNSTRENQTPAVLCRIYLGNYDNEGQVSYNTDYDPSGTPPSYFLDPAMTQWPGCRPCVAQRIWNVPKYSSWSPGQFIDQIDIQLRDDAGNLLYIPGVFGGTNFNKVNATNARFSPNNFQLTLHCSES